MYGAFMILMSMIRLYPYGLSNPFFSSRSAIFEQMSLNGLGRALQSTLGMYQFSQIDYPTKVVGFLLFNQYSNDYFQKSLRILYLFSNKIFIQYTLIPAIPLFLFTVIAVDPYLWIGFGNSSLLHRVVCCDILWSHSVLLYLTC